jgi:hypothetical protein
MKLGKLLGAGKSFFSGKGAASYREDKRVYLPKFNTDKNPFMPKSEENAPEPAPPKAKGKTVARPAVAPSAAPAAASARKFSPKFAGPSRVVSWKDKLNPFRTPVPSAPLMVGAVQTELSLDAVKVVHNDLADADIEVVPVKSRTVAVDELPMLPPARRPWEFLGERLIKAG